MPMTPAAKEILLQLEKELHESTLPKKEKEKWKKLHKYQYSESEAQFYLDGLRKVIKEHNERNKQ